jgi:hypothetical protein
MPANEVEALVRKELSSLSQPAVIQAMKMKRWTPVQVGVWGVGWGSGAGRGRGGKPAVIQAMKMKRWTPVQVGVWGWGGGAGRRGAGQGGQAGGRPGDEDEALDAGAGGGARSR